MKQLLIILLSVLGLTSLNAENYPYKSDYLWVTVPNHADWLYKTGEQASVEVQFYKYGIPRDGVVEYAIGNDLMEPDTKDTVTLKNGRGVIKAGTAKKPCFRDIRLTMKLDGTTYNHHVKIGFSPDKIMPYTKEPKDFWAFWQDNLKDAAKYPLKFTKTPCPEYSNDKTDCYLVRIDLNRQHQVMYGLLMMPKNAKIGSHPVVLSPPGAGIKRIKEPNSKDYYPEHGVIRLIMEIHGQNPLMPEEYFEGVRSAFDGRTKGYLYQGIDSRDHYYMKHVYMGLVRCIDFLCSLPEWDGKNVIVTGGSQGGALTIITAALNEKVTMCAPFYPALCDLTGFLHNRAGGWPKFFSGFYNDGKTDIPNEQAVETLQYFDVVNFARILKVPTFMSWGYNDDTCSPTSVWAAWNEILAPKEKDITPSSGHWRFPSSWDKCWKWMKALQ